MGSPPKVDENGKEINNGDWKVYVALGVAVVIVTIILRLTGC